MVQIAALVAVVLLLTEHFRLLWETVLDTFNRVSRLLSVQS